ncbi:MAG TPA: hypothetical protein VGF13_12695, partial [Verrucomicrobiae bacterium]
MKTSPTSPTTQKPNMKPDSTSTQQKVERLRVFVSHCVDDRKFVFEVCDLLVPYLGRENLFLFEKRPSLSMPFLQEIDAELENAQVIVIFVGKRFDKYMDY